MGKNTSTESESINELNTEIFYEGEAVDGWRQKIELDKWKQRRKGMVKDIMGKLLKESKTDPVSSPQNQQKKPPKQDGINTERNKKMEKLKANQAWVVGETMVWSIFVIINSIAGLSMMGLINLSHDQSHTVGRVALAFALLAFLYIAFLGSKQRSK